MELACPCDDKGPQYARVTKQFRGVISLPVGTASDNPIQDTTLYEVEYQDGYKNVLTANTVALNIFAQVDKEGN